jgi:hypothetical protein
VQDDAPIQDTSTEQEESHTQDDAPVQETSTEQDAAGSYTDEELLGAGWSKAQIDAMRNG